MPSQADERAAREADERRHREHVRAQLEHLAHALAHIAQRIESAVPRPPKRATLAVTTTMMPRTLETDGYRHNRLWAGQAMTIDIENTAGVTAGYPLNAGWNLTDFDNRVVIRAASVNTNLIWELTDYAS